MPVIHLVVNALAASAGGGLTYIRNVLPFLAAAPIRATVLVSPALRGEFAGISNVDFVELQLSPLQRFWYEQTKLPDLIRRCGANVLLSTGNFALRKSPVPQILLSRNSIYTSQDYFRDLKIRSEYRSLANTYVRAILAKKSVLWADVTIAPSEAFANELRQWSGASVIALHHGFDRDAFVRDTAPLADTVRAKLELVKTAFKLLFVSHYNYYRNFETLIRSLPILREKLRDRQIRLLLTCELAAVKTPGGYRPESAAMLVKSLGVGDMIVELGTIPYRQLHHLYSIADLYVSPAYTETFAHPLVEAMSSKLPIVVSDIPVHREICGEAATYFSKFSESELAESLMRAMAAPDRMKRMSMVGSQRAELFSWKTHVEQILEICRQLVRSQKS